MNRVVNNQALKELQENGYFLIKNIFSVQMIESVRSEAKSVFIEQMKKKDITQGGNDLPEEEFETCLFRFFKSNLQEFMNCGKQIQHLISLHRLSLDPLILNVLKQLGLEWPNICTRPVLFFNHSNLAQKEVYYRVFAHQDWRSMQGSLDAVVVWVPLVDIFKPLGALEVVPGSHRRGLLTSEVVESFGKVDVFKDSDFVSLETRQGDALFFSAFLVHRSGNNVTEHIRWSCHFRYNNLKESSFIERGYPHPYIYQPQEELLTPGFPPAKLVEEIFRHERKNH